MKSKIFVISDFALERYVESTLRLIFIKVNLPKFKLSDLNYFYVIYKHRHIPNNNLNHSSKKNDYYKIIN